MIKWALYQQKKIKNTIISCTTIKKWIKTKDFLAVKLQKWKKKQELAKELWVKLITN
jgi:hypothetical protein